VLSIAVALQIDCCSEGLFSLLHRISYMDAQMVLNMYVSVLGNISRLCFCVLRLCFGSNHPRHVSGRIRVHLLSALEFPSAVVGSALFQELLYLLWGTRAHAGDKSVKDQHEGDDGDDIGEEKMTWRSPEVKGRYEEEQGS
jgi:hypothetical protein